MGVTVKLKVWELMEKETDYRFRFSKRLSSPSGVSSTSQNPREVAQECTNIPQ